MGVSDRMIPVNFLGEIGYYRNMPKPEEITDWTPYLSLKTNNSVTEDVPENKSQESTTNWNFKF